MKLTIRFADQIVGALIILALGILIFVIFMLGSSQRWFSRDYNFRTYFNSATGLSQNMAVLYRGFTIGRVRNIRLAEDDRVEVHFTIFDTYIDRVRNGSLVEILISPIGGLGGNQFMFYPGTGVELVSEWSLIPAVSSTEGKRLQAIGLAIRPERDDSLNNILNRAGTLLSTLNDTIAEFQGSDQSDLGRIVRNMGTASAGLPAIVEKFPQDLAQRLDSLVAQIEPTLDNLHLLSDKLADPEGSLMLVLDSSGEVYTDLSDSLNSISLTLRNLEKTSDFIPSQLPQVAALLSELHTALKTAEDVLVALTNNPLLKRGIPEHREVQAGGMRSRDVEF
jgi:phospholipid/cholesterol/gamma-HCH transport system substrate-binding protein